MVLRLKKMFNCFWLKFCPNWILICRSAYFCGSGSGSRKLQILRIQLMWILAQSVKKVNLTLKGVTGYVWLLNWRYSIVEKLRIPLIPVLRIYFNLMRICIEKEMDPDPGHFVKIYWIFSTNNFHIFIFIFSLICIPKTWTIQKWGKFYNLFFSKVQI